MNVKLLRKIKKHILKEPRRFQMSDVIATDEPGALYEDCGIEFAVPACGTVACIAGWANLLSGDDTDSLMRAEELLGITNNQGTTLFLESHWPSKFDKRWWKAKTPRTRAKIAAERIEHFISTKGAE